VIASATMMLLVNIATIVLCFGVGGGLVVSLWRSCRGKPVVRTNTEHPRDILLLVDGTWCFREECDPELMLRDGDYRVVQRTSFEWHSHARHLPDRVVLRFVALSGASVDEPAPTPPRPPSLSSTPSSQFE